MGFWTDTKVTELTNLWSTSLSTREIGEKLGATKNMVTGKAQRLNLPSKKRKERVPKEQAKAKQKARYKKWFNGETGKKWREKRKQRKKLPPKNAKQITGVEVPLLQRRESQCAYLVGPHIMCGAPAFATLDCYGNPKTTSWCEYHWNLCHIKAA